MESPLKKCIVAGQPFTSYQTLDLLHSSQSIMVILLDLEMLREKMGEMGEQPALSLFLAAEENSRLEEFSSGKRRHEWLGGRLAAKYAVARLFELRTGVQNSGAWSGYMISADENGRPFVVPGGSETGDAEMPDISISHSGDRAVAMAADRGRCGVDIQKVTSKVQKVLDRFCSPEEKHILQRWGREIFEDETVLLTMLWAAKESLRKVAAVSPLPGFLELELVEVSSDLSGNGSGPWTFGFRSGKCPKDINCYVAVALVEHYVLALTAIDEAFLQA